MGHTKQVVYSNCGNASNNTSACEELVYTHKHELMLEGAHLHVRCCAHILNILVQDGM